LTRVNIQPQALAEAEEAALWYERQRPGLGIQFILELNVAIERAVQFPRAYERLYREARRVLLRRLPYAVYFVDENDGVETITVLHQRRASWIWESRVR
jgi:plasmid stabilization system protein ParE